MGSRGEAQSRRPQTTKKLCLPKIRTGRNQCFALPSNSPVDCFCAENPIGESPEKACNAFLKERFPASIFKLSITQIKGRLKANSNFKRILLKCARAVRYYNISKIKNTEKSEGYKNENRKSDFERCGGAGSDGGRDRSAVPRACCSFGAAYCVTEMVSRERCSITIKKRRSLSRSAKGHPVAIRCSATTRYLCICRKARRSGRAGCY